MKQRYFSNLQDIEKQHFFESLIRSVHQSKSLIKGQSFITFQGQQSLHVRGLSNLRSLDIGKSRTKTCFNSQYPFNKTSHEFWANAQMTFVLNVNSSKALHASQVNYQLRIYNQQMFGFSFPQVVYYPVPPSIFGMAPPPSYFMPTYSQFQKPHEEIKVEIPDTKNSKGRQQAQPARKFSESLSEKQSPEAIPRLFRPQRTKRIQKSTAKAPKKYLFKNSYLSFAAHKLLSFVGSRNLSQRLVKTLIKRRKTSPQDADKAIKLFYSEHNHVMKYVVNNSSIRKLRELWTGEFVGKFSGKLKKQQAQFYAFIYRTLSKIYFEEHYYSFLLRSKKVRKLTMNFHLKMRRYLLRNLRNPENFICYEGFD